MQVTNRCVVLGAAQGLLAGAPRDAAGRAMPDPDVVLRAVTQKVEVTRRHSGGGGVWLAQGAQVWIDLCVPAGDPMAVADVNRAAWWVGDVWAGVLTDLGVEGAVPHKGPLVTSEWSSQVCFAGLGPGEVTVGGRKVVGCAQRRTREGARFQTTVLLDWDPVPLVNILGLSVAAGAAVADVAVGLHELLPGVGEEDVKRALLSALPTNGD